MIRFGIAGHRNFDNTKIIDFLNRQYLTIFKHAQTRRENVTAVSAVAEGADTFFAEAAVSLKIPLEIVRPFAQYAADFQLTESLRRYESLRGCAVREITMPFDERSDAAYQAAMYWVVENCDVLVAVWNGKSSAQPGGTKDAIDRAISLNKSWIHINVDNLSVDFYQRGQKWETTQIQTT